MFTVKYIGVYDEKGHQQYNLFGGKEVTFEIINCKPGESDEKIRNLLRDGIPNRIIWKRGYSYIGLNIPDKDRKEVISFMFLQLFDGKEWTRYVIQDGWVYIMHNGKTIDKYDFINN